MLNNISTPFFTNNQKFKQSSQKSLIKIAQQFGDGKEWSHLNSHGL